jgi:hypothetical protein
MLPNFLPKKPEKYYENFTWGEYLYTNGKRKSKDFYLSFIDSREIVRNLKLKNNREWREWCKNKPKEYFRIPSSPEQTYQEWINWYDWLGKG